MMKRQYAHPGKRFQGQFLDSLITIMLFVSGIFISKALPDFVGSIVAIVLPASYYLFSDALPKGQSLGKKLLGISVVHKESGEYCNIGQSFIRNFLTPIFGIIDAVLIFGEERQRLGDMLAKTIVVKSS